jgi:hypothetical protein
MKSRNTKSGVLAQMHPDRRNATVTGLWSSLTIIGLLAGAPSRAAALPPSAGKIVLMAGPTGADHLSEGNLQTEDRRVARDLRNAAIGSAQRVAHPSVTGTPNVLTPHGLASTSVRPVAMETRLLVRVSWSHGEVQTADSNPFARVGNRSGLVSATQAEVRDGQVWLTDRGGVEGAENGGYNHQAAP